MHLGLTDSISWLGVANGAVIVIVAVATLLIGLLQRGNSARSRQLAEAIAHRKEISDLTFATKEEMNSRLEQIDARITRLETVMEILHLGQPAEDDAGEP
jgi:hypothetical protein